MVIHAERTVSTDETKYSCELAGKHLLRKQDSWSEVVSKSEHFRYPIIPIKVLGIYVEEVAARQRSPWRVQHIQRLMNQFAEFTETFIYGANI